MIMLIAILLAFVWCPRITVAIIAICLVTNVPYILEALQIVQGWIFYLAA